MVGALMMVAIIVFVAETTISIGIAAMEKEKEKEEEEEEEGERGMQTEDSIRMPLLVEAGDVTSNSDHPRTTAAAHRWSIVARGIHLQDPGAGA
jgi:hypothetical protein